jgi:hypothetical protein
LAADRDLLLEVLLAVLAAQVVVALATVQAGLPVDLVLLDKEMQVELVKRQVLT